jgi:hypothetical protein
VRAAAFAATIALLVAPSVAGATELSREELASVASRAAAGDGAAAGELDAVTTVDGAAVDLEAALDGADAAEREARLRELAVSAGADPESGLPDATGAREQAQEIEAANEPAPQSPSSGVGGDERSPLGGLGVPLWLALALAVVAVVIGALVARRAGARRVLDLERDPAEPRAKGPRPRDFEREADEAERRGDYAAAVRLRFRAGLGRLAEAEALRLHPALTAPGAARELRSPKLWELAGDYDEIVFGQRAAAAADAEAARSGWQEVLREARA